jgi:hypothetical protein
MGAKSLIANTSTSWLWMANLKNVRPMRPKPLMPTFICFIYRYLFDFYRSYVIAYLHWGLFATNNLSMAISWSEMMKLKFFKPKHFYYRLLKSNSDNHWSKVIILNELCQCFER